MDKGNLFFLVGGDFDMKDPDKGKRVGAKLRYE
jgi:hypothetical protein